MGVILSILLAAVFCIIVAIIAYRFEWYGVKTWFTVLSVLFIAIDVAFFADIIYKNMLIKGDVEAYKQRYASLVYQLENNLYDNNNDLGKKELYNQIQRWNEDLAKYKTLQNDFWVGAFYPNIYDQFEFIELK